MLCRPRRSTCSGAVVRVRVRVRVRVGVRVRVRFGVRVSPPQHLPPYHRRQHGVVTLVQVLDDEGKPVGQCGLE